MIKETRSTKRKANANRILKEGNEKKKWKQLLGKSSPPTLLPQAETKWRKMKSTLYTQDAYKLYITISKTRNFFLAALPVASSCMHYLQSCTYLLACSFIELIHYIKKKCISIGKWKLQRASPRVCLEHMIWDGGDHSCTIKIKLLDNFN